MIEMRHLAKRFVGARPSAVAGLRSNWFRRATAEQHEAAVVHAVRDMNFRALDGQITGLLGPNGAGKTTSLRMLAGLIQPDAGELEVGGVNVVEQPKQALALMGVLSDSRGLYPRLTARENIVYYGQLQGMPVDQAHDRADSLAQLLDLRPLMNRRTEGFSQGERMKTALARALVHDPAHIVLDEPTNGLDVLATRALREALRHLASPAGGSKCIVFCTHIMQEVERLCDQVVVVAHGQNIAEGTVPALCALANESQFEEAFVKLAFAEVPPADTFTAAAAANRLFSNTVAAEKLS